MGKEMKMRIKAKMKKKLLIYKLVIATLLTFLALSLLSNVMLILADNKTDVPNKAAITVYSESTKNSGEIIKDKEKMPAPDEEQPKTEAKEVLYYDVPLSHELQDYLRERCAEYGIDMKLALAVMKTESNFVPSIISETNDYGLMQINHSNHEWLGQMLDLDDFLDEKQNIEAGLYMLNHAFLNSDTTHKALMVYNFGLAGATECWEQGLEESVYSNAVMMNYESIEVE